jgi:CDP-diacylglycerol--glycerol-3-phosphate 3-phosphatidyltransferase
MFSEKVRNVSESTVTQIAKVFGAMGFTPNMLTLLGTLFMMSTGVMVSYGYLITASFATIFFAGFDALDGALARYTGSVSKFGGFFDSVLDRYADMALMLGMADYLLHQGYDPKFTCYLTFIALCGSVLVPYTRARAEGLGFNCKGGLFSRFERLVTIVLTLFLAGLFNDDVLVWGMGIIAVFANITAVQRMLHVYELDNEDMAKEKTKQ